MTAPHPVLDLPMQPNDAQAGTVREYLISLLSVLLDQGENAIKRPFGNSGWEYELYAPLITAGVVEGEFDEDGEIESINHREAEAILQQAILDL
jgi:hypothetical protein